MSVNFHPMFKDFADLLKSKYSWAVADNDEFSVKNMTDQEFAESIIEDILAATVFEMEGRAVNFGLKELFRNLDQAETKRGLKLLETQMVAEFLSIENSEVRIKKTSTKLTEAMLFCGVCFETELTNSSQILSAMLAEGEAVIMPVNSIKNTEVMKDVAEQLVIKMSASEKSSDEAKPVFLTLSTTIH